jgi:hypothetical protein
MFANRSVGWTCGEFRAMPDVTITCPSCGKTITVSEFVDLSKLVCRACGCRFAASDSETLEEDNDATQEERSHPEPVVTTTTPAQVVVIAKVKPRPRKLFRWTYQLKCWFVFACVGIVSLVLRYGGLLGSNALEVLIEYGPLAVFAFHFYITFRAFRESVLAGILCLLVPFYSLYYAFWSFEDYMFRAVFAGMLVGTGCDCLAFIYKYGAMILPGINDFFTSEL